jgi:hypothetical protein
MAKNFSVFPDSLVTGKQAKEMAAVMARVATAPGIQGGILSFNIRTTTTALTTAMAGRAGIK